MTARNRCMSRQAPAQSNASHAAWKYDITLQQERRLRRAMQARPSKRFGDGSVRLKSSKDAFRKLTVAIDQFGCTVRLS
eukprot:1160625-Pelagomonas_calceolata.AAC.11